MSPFRNAILTPPKTSPLQILLLIQLETSPKYGYEMLKLIKEAFEGVWEPKTGTLYPALKSLEKRGLVDTQNRDGVDFYLITIKGQKFLQQIGKHQKRSMKFSTRFFTTLTKWMSPELKKSILSSITVFVNEDIDFIERARVNKWNSGDWIRHPDLHTFGYSSRMESCKSQPCRGS